MTVKHKACGGSAMASRGSGARGGRTGRSYRAEPPPPPEGMAPVEAEIPTGYVGEVRMTQTLVHIQGTGDEGVDRACRGGQVTDTQTGHEVECDTSQCDGTQTHTHLDRHRVAHGSHRSHTHYQDTQTMHTHTITPSHTHTITHTHTPSHHHTHTPSHTHTITHTHRQTDRPVRWRCLPGWPTGLPLLQRSL